MLALCWSKLIHLFRNYLQQDSIVGKVLKLSKDKMSECINFQSCFVNSWNPAINEVLQLLYLPLSKFDETSHNGCVQALIEMIYDYGFLVKDPIKKGFYKAREDVSARKLLIFGDGLSITNLNMSRTESNAKLPSQERLNSVLKVLPSIYY